jgi:hypothetical protein
MTNPHLWHSRLMHAVLRCASEHSHERRSSPSRNLRNKSRAKKHLSLLAARASLQSVFQGSFIDKERSEIVSLSDSDDIDVIRGEVLRSPRYSRKFQFERRSCLE